MHKNSVESQDVTTPPMEREAYHARLDKQHSAIYRTMNSLYPFKDLVTSPLNEDIESPHILDVGTGSGRWAIEMAVTFPSAYVLGLDVFRPNFTANDGLPENCRFEVHDINHPVDNHDGHFTLVHARFMESGVTDVDRFFYDTARILKPGGIFILGVADPQLWYEDFEPVPWGKPGVERFSWAQYLFGVAYRAGWRRGIKSICSSLWFEDWLEQNSNYGNILKEDVYVPLGPWKDGLNRDQLTAANLMLQSVTEAFASWKELLQEDGYLTQDISLWIEESIRELESFSLRAYFRIKYLAVVRTDIPWVERRNPPPPADTPSRTPVMGLVFD